MKRRRTCPDCGHGDLTGPVGSIWLACACGYRSLRPEHTCPNCSSDELDANAGSSRITCRDCDYNWEAGINLENEDKLSKQFEDDVICVAPIMVDGGTRFSMDFVPEAMHPSFRTLIEHLRQPRSREQDQQDRARGGYIAPIPVPGRWDPGTKGSKERFFHKRAEIKVSGVRRQVIVIHIHGVIRLLLNVESGEARLQLKAPILWAEGYEKTAEYWLDAILWMLSCQRCTLEDCYPLWRMSGLELCSDFTGLNFRKSDGEKWVGVRKTGNRFHYSEDVEEFGYESDAETINLGSRASPVSVCIYDKNSQVISQKGGDWSTYQAVHEAHGYDGISKIWRVELRFAKRGLILEDKRGLIRWNDQTEKNEKLPLLFDFRDPKTAASDYALWLLWAYTTMRKRLIVPDARTRRKRAPMDWRWQAVSELGLPDRSRLEYIRMHREVHRDAWKNRVRRAALQFARAGRQIAALHGRKDFNGPAILSFMDDSMKEAEREDLAEYMKAYADMQKAFIGQEIDTKGRDAWRNWEDGRERDGPEARAVKPGERPDPWVPISAPTKTYVIKKRAYA